MDYNTMDLQGLAALLDNVNVFIIVVEQVTNRMLYVNKQFFLLQNFTNSLPVQPLL